MKMPILNVNMSSKSKKKKINLTKSSVN